MGEPLTVYTIAGSYRIFCLNLGHPLAAVFHSRFKAIAGELCTKQCVAKAHCVLSFAQGVQLIGTPVRLKLPERGCNPAATGPDRLNCMTMRNYGLLQVLNSASTRGNPFIGTLRPAITL